MSRIGKKPVPIPGTVTASLDDRTVEVKGPKGALTAKLSDLTTVEIGEGVITVSPINESREARAAWGMSRTIVANLVEGVEKGFEKRLELSGVGYRAQMQGTSLQLALGFSHNVIYPVPEGIEIAVPRPTEIVVGGIVKQKVGQVAAEIRSFRPPEPYKGKGVRYAGEFIVRKEGKKK